VVAICDTNPDNLKAAIDQAAAAGHSPDPYTEYRKLLERKDIDAVVIATPVDFHKEMAIAALEIGRMCIAKSRWPSPRRIAARSPTPPLPRKGFSRPASVAP